MAFTNDEWYHLEYRLTNARRNMRYHDEYSDPWTKARLAMEEILSVKKANQTLPQVGDLITDTEHPNDGLGVILEVRDRRKSKDVYRVLAGKGPMWLDKDYIEYQCRLLS
jgi:hypothetical protein